MPKKADRTKNPRGDAMHRTQSGGNMATKRADGKWNSKTESQTAKEYQKYGWKVEYSTDSEEGFSKKA